MLLYGLAFIISGVAGDAACPGATTIAINACRKARSDAADAEMNRYYQAALKRLRSEREDTVATALVKAQRSWLVYRDAECGAVFDYWSGGTIRASMELACETRLTELRTYALWQHWLTYMDSTPPILPRPRVESVLSER